MELFEAVKGRHSARAYSDKPVESEKVDRILEAGSLAPSAVNSQPWRFYVAESGEARAKVFKAMMGFNKWAERVPVFIVVLADLDSAYRKEAKNYKIDIGLCLENMMLAAEALGLGCCPIAGFENSVLVGELGLPENLEPEIILPVGYEIGKEGFGKLQGKYGNLERAQHKKGGRKKMQELVFRRE